jgi:hypothetical protein
MAIIFSSISITLDALASAPRIGRNSLVEANSPENQRNNGSVGLCPIAANMLKAIGKS